MSEKWWMVEQWPPGFAALTQHESVVLDAPFCAVEPPVSEACAAACVHDCDDVWALDAMPDVSALGRVHEWCMRASASSKRAVLANPAVVDFFVRLFTSPDPADHECQELGCAALALLANWAAAPAAVPPSRGLLDALCVLIKKHPGVFSPLAASATWCLFSLLRGETDVLLCDKDLVAALAGHVGAGHQTGPCMLLHTLIPRDSWPQELKWSVIQTVHTAVLATEGPPQNAAAYFLREARFADFPTLDIDEFCVDGGDWIASMREVASSAAAPRSRRVAALAALLFVPSFHPDVLPKAEHDQLQICVFMGLMSGDVVIAEANMYLLRALCRYSPDVPFNRAHFLGTVLPLMIKMSIVKSDGGFEHERELVVALEACQAILIGALARGLHWDLKQSADLCSLSKESHPQLAPDFVSYINLILQSPVFSDHVHERALAVMINLLQITRTTAAQDALLEEASKTADVLLLLEMAAHPNPTLRSAAVFFLGLLTIREEGASSVFAHGARAYDVFASACTSTCKLSLATSASALVSLNNLARRYDSARAYIRGLEEVKMAAFRFLHEPAVRLAASDILEETFDVPDVDDVALDDPLQFCVPFSPPAPRTCVICFEEDCQEVSYLCCLHVFHSSCLRTWLVAKNTCPLCQSPAAWSFFETAQKLNMSYVSFVL